MNLATLNCEYEIIYFYFKVLLHVKYVFRNLKIMNEKIVYFDFKALLNVKYVFRNLEIMNVKLYFDFKVLLRGKLYSKPKLGMRNSLILR